MEQVRPTDLRQSATLDYTGLTADDVIAPNFRERIFHPEDVEKFETSERLLSRGDFRSNSSIERSGRTANTAGS